MAVLLPCAPVAVMVTPGNASPCASTIRPESVPVVSCAEARPPIEQAMSVMMTTTHSFFMPNPLKRPGVSTDDQPHLRIADQLRRTVTVCPVPELDRWAEIFRLGIGDQSRAWTVMREPESSRSRLIDRSDHCIVHQQPVSEG